MRTTLKCFEFGFVFFSLLFLFSNGLTAQENASEASETLKTSQNSVSGMLSPSDAALIGTQAVPDERVRQLLVAKRIVWTSPEGTENAEELLKKPLGQTSTADMHAGFCMKKLPGKESAILLDFGTEIHGGIRLEARDLKFVNEAQQGRTVRVRVRFGESADEAMSEIGEKGSMNDHSIRDMEILVPWLGAVEFGESAFRFVRLDLTEEDSAVWFDSVRAVYTYRDLPWVGSFRSSDDRLNAIWTAAAHTQHLTMQTYVFEGAKRDRLVWYGDIYPQTCTTLRVFGAPKVLTDSLGRYALDVWGAKPWMNGMANYSIWHLLSVYDIYEYTGNRAYIEIFHDSFRKLLHEKLRPQVKESGEASFPSPFLDWPTAENRPALDAGTHAMFVLAFDRLAKIGEALGDAEMTEEARALETKTRQFLPQHHGNKQAAALMFLAGLDAPNDPKTSDLEALSAGGAHGFSTFYGYYMLEALARGGRTQEALDIVRTYWGAMLDVGATTFWEDFDLAWLEEAGRIDEITPPNLKSLHGDHGAFCYKGFRHSLCHGWASGPAAWISDHILGVESLEPGFKTVRIVPFLGDLKWAEGTVPTPYGPIFVRHEKDAQGTIHSEVRLPEGVTQVQ